MTSFSSTDPLPPADIVQHFFEWIRHLMHQCGGKDVYFNDRSIIKGAFEEFTGGEPERLNTWYEMLLYTNISG